MINAAIKIDPKPVNDIEIFRSRISSKDMCCTLKTHYTVRHLKKPDLFQEFEEGGRHSPVSQSVEKARQMVLGPEFCKRWPMFFPNHSL